MDRFARVVLGYHGSEPEFAEALLRGEVGVDQWNLSENPYDWLGKGIYFWEYAPERARDWAKDKAVIGAVIQLGVCRAGCVVRKGKQKVGEAVAFLRGGARESLRRRAPGPLGRISDA